MIVTARHLDIMAHAIGLNRISEKERRKVRQLGDAYRNSYVAAGGTPEEAECRRLVATGKMTDLEIPLGGQVGSSWIFHVTEAGFDDLVDAGRVSRQGELFARRAE